ncbi:MAG: hypothetical protein DRJ32_00560 [Thermoprotei archaeon]|nr:MAG: hypothetical protein DRJ32_00560 [Thermoprotei archaeon]HDD63738.1 hypothetical protein [Thermoprotei archaeon]
MPDKVITTLLSDLEKLFRYALAHCEYVCPERRDPETCIIMSILSKKFGIKLPCEEDYGEFKRETFEKLIKEIEIRRGKKIDEVIRELEKNGYKSLQDQIDHNDAIFAVEVLRAYDKRKLLSEEKEKE